MVRFPEWKNSSSDSVLRLLARAEIAVTPGAITINLQRELERPPSRTTITRAIKGLREQGLIRRIEDGQPYYQITDQGRAYLDGEYDPDGDV
ncbi:MAG: ArsR family transcriptional regulator [Haloferacaceae archaeon]